jgi:hypothetical protein
VLEHASNAASKHVPLKIKSITLHEFVGVRDDNSLTRRYAHSYPLPEVISSILDRKCPQ